MLKIVYNVTNGFFKIYTTVDGKTRHIGNSQGYPQWSISFLFRTLATNKIIDSTVTDKEITLILE